MKATIGFYEIPAADFGRAVKFYENAFGFEIESCEWETEKMGFIASDTLRGSISWAKDFNPSKDGVCIHYDVDNINPMLEKINKFGGKTLIPKTKIEAEGQGSFALFLDSEGNRIGLHSQE